MMYNLSSGKSSCTYMDLLGTVAYLQKACISFVISAVPSTCLQILARLQLDGFLS
jgi:hypothetical protein